MKKFIYSNLAYYKSTTLLKMNFFIGVFKDFYCKLQNTYFPEHLSVVASDTLFKDAYKVTLAELCGALGIPIL